MRTASSTCSMNPESTIALYSTRQRIRERVDELLLRRVVLVLQPVRAGGRDDREEALRVHALERGAQVRDVVVDRGAVVLDRAGAHVDARRRRRDLVLGERAEHLLVVLRVGARERLPVAARWQERVLRSELARPDAADPVVEVGDPVRLAELAVADDVDPAVGLAPDDVGDLGLQRLRVGRLVVGLAALDRGLERQQGRRPDEASHVRGTNAHVSLPLRGLQCAFCRTA